MVVMIFGTHELKVRMPMLKIYLLYEFGLYKLFQCAIDGNQIGKWGSELCPELLNGDWLFGL